VVASFCRESCKEGPFLSAKKGAWEELDCSSPARGLLAGNSFKSRRPACGLAFTDSRPELLVSPKDIKSESLGEETGPEVLSYKDRKSGLLVKGAAAGVDNGAPVEEGPSSKPSNSWNGSYEALTTGVENESPSLMSIRSIRGADAGFGTPGAGIGSFTGLVEAPFSPPRTWAAAALDPLIPFTGFWTEEPPNKEAAKRCFSAGISGFLSTLRGTYIGTAQQQFHT
jgi:hypothetical protein